ncbi:MAG: GPP34 family phosphoprotein [Bifidobacteriaceae bacterium]|jgi:hypothetical protein|nr:GPP34 family phosphoprotein [Bifidobacteriaceae bacterium]
MPSLSLTQEYLLCAVRPDGKPPASFSTSFQACLAAGGVAELLDGGYFALDGKGKLVAAAPWNGALPHLEPLRQAIASFKKPPTPQKLADRYIVMDGKLAKALFVSIGESLVRQGCATASTEDGWLGSKTRFQPLSGAVAAVTGRVRAKMLGDAAPSPETVCLVTLLDKSNLLKQNFDRPERAVLRRRLKEAHAGSPRHPAEGLVDYVSYVDAAVAGMTAALVTTTITN